jgi:NADH-quinone oxidoreductase subunit L
MEVSWLHLIFLLPLLGAAVNGLLGQWLPKATLYAIALLVVLLSFCIGLFAWFQIAGLEGDAAQLRQIVFTWFSVGSLKVDLGLTFDRLSGTLVLVVTGVGFLIHLYSVGYMDKDPAYWRYFAYLNLFVSMMLILVLADNLVAMFVGWEGVGLCSYLLIGFWYDDEKKAYAGRKAFVVNRIGDFGFLIGIFVVYLYTGQVSFHALRLAPLSLGVASAAGALLFVGAIGKSAQLPLYVWLPDAMAGPTPVSALIHAATMVTAGVYMVARLSFLYVQAPGVMAAVATIGVLTALVGAVIGTSQMDIKKVLAYSTVSQLGYMFIGVGVGAFAAGTAHLITHAFFKACLFLGSGAVIHGLHDEQDMARMGGLRRLGLKHTAATFFVATVAITGVLPISGFFSKDEILAQALNTRAFDFLTAWDPGLTNVPILRPLLETLSRTRLTFLGPTIYVVGTLIALITSFYMWRCYLLTFEGEYRGPAEVHPHEAPWVMTVPLWILASLSVVGLLIVLPSHSLPFSWEHFTEGVFARPRGGAPMERLPELLTFGIAAVVAWAGAATAWSLYAPGRALQGDERIASAFPRLRRALANALYVDAFYNWAVSRPLFAGARALWRVVDATLIDGLLINGSAQAVAALGSVLRRFQNGDVQRYAAVTAVGVLILVYVFLVRG